MKLVNVWDGSEWIETPDWRGVEVWAEDGSSRTITRLGDHPQEGETTTKPEIEESDPMLGETQMNDGGVYD